MCRFEANGKCSKSTFIDLHVTEPRKLSRAIAKIAAITTRAVLESTIPVPRETTVNVVSGDRRKGVDI